MIKIEFNYDGDIAESDQLLEGYYSNAIPRTGEYLCIRLNKKNDFIMFKILSVRHYLELIDNKIQSSVELFIQKI